MVMLVNEMRNEKGEMRKTLRKRGQLMGRDARLAFYVSDQTFCQLFLIKQQFYGY